MKRGIALLAVAVVLVGVAGIAAAGPVGTAVAQDDPTATNETDEGNETDISPGEQLSGVIGVQRAEISGEVESRSFEVALNRTESPEERADLVAERLNGTEERLVAIERRQRDLRERRDAGELSQGAFAARMAETSARAEAAKREANRSANVARGLPEAARTNRGLDEARLNEVRQRAGEASGPEVAAIARGVAGNDVGGPLASERRGPPGDVGAGGGPDRGNGSGAGDGSGTGDRQGTGNGPPGDGPSDGGNETDDDGNAGSAGSGVSTSGSANTSDGANGGTGAGDGNATPPRDDPSSPVDGEDGDDNRGDGPGVGDGDEASANAVNVVGAVTERLAGPLADGSDFVRGVLGSTDG